ncbi:hypothetical protein WEI85_42790 [Actinomycetes bacterium KLBMP 9797]
MLPSQLTQLLGDHRPSTGDQPGADDQPGTDDWPGVAEALGVVDGFDDAFVHGFGRVSDGTATTLAALAGALAGTPLGHRVAEAVDKVVAGSIADEHLAALAGARTALLGAVHDALLARFDAALGRHRAPWEGPTTAVQAPPNLLAGARSWLRELAVTGWRGVDHDVVSASAQILQAVLDEPRLRRLAVLLDGLATELEACSPVSTAERIPARRWADLWARALMLSQPGGQAAGAASAGAAGAASAGAAGAVAAGAVSGRLLVLGVDVHEHGTAVQFQVHGVLEPAGGAPARLVRTSLAAAKVDTIVGPAVWQLAQSCPVLLAALAERRALELTDLPLLPSGDLVWHDERAEPGEPADPFATARVLLPGALAPAVPPLDRHPVRLAEPVLVEGYTATVDGSTGAVTLDVGGQPLAVAVDRLPTSGPLTRELVARSTACLGLVRWDGRWTLQPLAVQATVKRKTVAVHTADWAQGPTDPKAAKAAAAAGDTVAVLRERAGRLLRK